MSDVGDHTVTAARPERSFLARQGLTATDGAIIGAAFVLCIAFGPTMSYPSWTPRMAVVLAVLPIGLLVLVRQAISGDRSARWACVVAGWVVVAGLASGFPRSALLGFVARDMSGLLVIGCLAIWAVGRELSERGRQVLAPAVLVGLALSLVVGVLQLAFDVTQGTFAMNGGRPSGLTTNPVYFGGLMVGAGMWSAALASMRRSDDLAAAPAHRRVLLLGATGAFAAGASISGSRVSILALVLLVGALLVWRRSSALVPVAATFVGVVGGTLLQQAVGSSVDALSRAGDGGGGLDGRLQVWRYTLSAIAERPVFGWGFGRFQPSVQRHYSVDFVRDFATRDLGVAWFDAHNIVLGIADAIGVIGLVLMAVWLLSAVRGADRTLLVFPFALFVTWMLQPPALATLPLAALVLGASTAPVLTAVSGTRRRSSSAGRVAVVIGLLAGAYLVAADVVFYAVTDRFDAEASERVEALYLGDPVAAGLVAQVWAIAADDNAAPEAIAWQERAVDRDPERPYWRARLAERYLLADRYDDAWLQLERALELQPYHADSLTLRIVVAARLQDEERLRMAIADACELDQTACSLDVEDVLEQAR